MKRRIQHNDKKLSTVIAVTIGLCTLVGLGYKYDQRLAKADNVTEVAKFNLFNFDGVLDYENVFEQMRITTTTMTTTVQELYNML